MVGPNNHTKGQVPRPRQTGQEARMGLLVFMIMQSRREGRREKKHRPGLARQAGKQACSLSELEGRPPPPPPRPLHLQVEGEKMILLIVGSFSGTHGVHSPLTSEYFGNRLLVKLIVKVVHSMAQSPFDCLSILGPNVYATVI